MGLFCGCKVYRIPCQSEAHPSLTKTPLTNVAIHIKLTVRAVLLTYFILSMKIIAKYPKRDMLLLSVI